MSSNEDTGRNGVAAGRPAAAAAEVWEGGAANRAGPCSVRGPPGMRGGDAMGRPLGCSGWGDSEGRLGGGGGSEP